MRQRIALLVCIAASVPLFALLAAETDSVEKADRLFELQHYREAAEVYENLMESKGEGWHAAARRLVESRLSLGLYDDAIDAAQRYIELTEGTPHEARAQRMTGNLYLQVPHWGTRAGGEFHRGERRQGIFLQSWQFDKKHAVRHLERARQLYADYEANNAALADLPPKEREGWHAERIACLFDLANAVARFSIYEDEPHFWYRWWGERDEFLAETAGEDDFDEGYSHWEMTRKRPIGLRVGPDGSPLFPVTPDTYADDLPDDEKILFLLEEVRRLDRSDAKESTALSYYRQAMLARKRFGMDRLNTCASLYSVNGRRPLQEKLETLNPWELGDEEALVLAGGQIRKVELPPQYDVLQLLRLCFREYPRSNVAPEGRYAAGLYYQSRQQYNRALDAYAALSETAPGSEWARHGGTQSKRILAPQVRLSDSSVQMPGEPAEIEFSYRNASSVSFTAHRIRLKELVSALQEKLLTQTDEARRYQHLVDRWHAVLAQQNKRSWEYSFLSPFIGEQVGKWAAEVENDGSHRYAHTTVGTPLTTAGVFLVTAQVAGGGVAGRSVVALTDLSILEKTTKDGLLCYVADADTGAPVAGAGITALETWNVYSRATRKNLFRAQVHKATTDGQGMYVHKTPPEGRSVHFMVESDGRLAWTGMGYWPRYRPSARQSGTFAYAVTDRPVYRPEQTVRYKVWMRQSSNGVLSNLPQAQYEVTVFDTKGNKVHEVRKATDDFGAIDGEFELLPDAALGLYRLQIDGVNRGGTSFRVEEYKKPEFEVVVEPDSEHARLGTEVKAVVKATYYWGEPVTDATVAYRVFREEYAGRVRIPGRWDWLYGPGYGLGAYAPAWRPRADGPFPGRERSFWPGYRPPNPVRELVSEGTARLDDKGETAIAIDTASALESHGDLDHRYVVEADVRDASRRVISGEGAVVVTRSAFYARVQANRGYCRPGEETQVSVRCTTPSGKPVSAEGLITVSHVVFGGPDNAHIDRTELQRWTESTEANGSLSFSIRPERSGLLEVRFAAPDSWGETVEGIGYIWVVGRDFNGRLYRFNDLELITDKRTYRPGETCHLMINTRRPDSYVLFADKVDNGTLIDYSLLHLEDGHTIVDLPVREGQDPAFFVEATTVSDMRVHEQVRRICVPPEDEVAEVTIRPDKEEYRPGEQATVHVSARTVGGDPARMQVALTAFDKSILYIQPELAASISEFFHGQMPHHRQWMQTNLLTRYAAWGELARPFQQLHPVPPAWNGTWGPEVDRWDTFAAAQNRFFGRGDVVMSEAAVGGGLRAASAPAMADAVAGPGAMEAPSPAPEVAKPEIRQDFADAAVWLPAVTTDEAGEATVTFRMPENLTTWKMKAWAMGKNSRTGEAAAEAVTTKNLLVRLQAPRFFMERDEVVLSANVHNYLSAAKNVGLVLEVPEEHLELLPDQTAETSIEVAAKGEVRADWRVRVLKEGTAQITVKALTDEESDAMRMSFPVLVHGMTKQDAYCGSVRPDEVDAVRSVEFTIPQERRPELTVLEVQFAPSLVGAMLDALPYCIEYPYGCTEQTISRFLPAVLTLKTLRNMGIELEDVRRIRGRMDEVRRIEEGEHASIYANSPVFDSDRLYGVITKGLRRIEDMQNADGGWGWWSNGSSSGYQTSYVLYGLLSAQGPDVRVDEALLQRGLRFLSDWEAARMRRKHWQPSATDAFVAYVLSMRRMRVELEEEPDGIARLYAGRGGLNLYGKALLTLALANLDERERADVVLRNIMQYLERNDETQVAWFRTPETGWWYWYNSDIETNAWCLRALVRLAPDHEAAPMLVKWLLENRRNGYYWRSTRDTTLCVAAMSEYVEASGEGDPDYALAISVDDGAFSRRLRISKDNFFTYGNRFVVRGEALGGGSHTLTLNKKGRGALYYSANVRYFTKEEDISASGLQLKIERTYYLLKRIPYVVEVEDAQGRKIRENRLRYERVPLAEGDAVRSGDVVQVELRVTSDNDYTYLLIEDPKPAGCEPVEVRSGGDRQEGFYTYSELRDEKVAFFADGIGRGEHLLRYRLRVEIPGCFHALPATIAGMYAPELRGNSGEYVMEIVDR